MRGSTGGKKGQEGCYAGVKEKQGGEREEGKRGLNGGREVGSSDLSNQADLSSAQ